MSASKLLYISEDVSRRLAQDVEKNIDRYLFGHFRDLEQIGGWSLELRALTVDLSSLNGLSHLAEGPEEEVRNSLIVWRALSHLPPSLARESRIWTRLSHLECLEYARVRWLHGLPRDKAVAAIRTHFFADTLTKCRDDHAIGRLWWNAYIANLARPDDVEGALRAVLKTADIRSNVVERSAMTSRPKVAAGIVASIISNPSITSTEDAFRLFMKTVNRRGGGRLFELLDEQEVSAFFDDCAATVTTQGT